MAHEMRHGDAAIESEFFDFHPKRSGRERQGVLPPSSHIFRLPNASWSRLVSPAMLNGLERESLIQCRQANQRVDHRTEYRSLAEFHTEYGGHQVEVGNAHQTPVQSTNYKKHSCDHI